MHILDILLPIFLVMGLGALSVFLKVFKPQDSLIFSKYDYNIGFPILLFYTLVHTHFEQIGSPAFIGANILSLLAVSLLMLAIGFLLRLPKPSIGIMVVAAMFGNSAYMGIPVLQQLYGSEGTSYASLIVGIQLTLVLSVGIFMLEALQKRKPNVRGALWHLVKNPLIISVVLGIVCSLLSVTLPAFLENFLGMVSKSASPIALFAIGMFLVGKKLSPQPKKIALICFMKLIALPLITFGIAKALGITGIAFSSTLLEGAMPLAATTFVIAQTHGIEEEMISSSIVLTTLLSFGTLSVLLLLMKVYNPLLL